MAARPNVAPRKPWYLGRFCNGSKSTKMTVAPVKVPALPMPEIARPIMKAGEVGAAAQMIEPISKITMAVMKVHLAEKKVCCAMDE